MEENKDIHEEELDDVVEKKDIIEAMDEQDDSALRELIENEYFIDIAEAVDEFDDEEIRRLFEMIDDDSLAQVIEQADEDLQDRMILLLVNERILNIFSYMSNDDVVDILGNLPTDRRKELINLMTKGESKIITTLLGYAEDTAGGIMTTEFVAMNIRLSIQETIEKLRVIAPKTEVIDVIYIVNDRRELVGTVDLRDILISPDNGMIRDILNENFKYVYPDTDQEEVAYQVSKYDLKAIPVVNTKKQILGIITIDDIIDVINEEHNEDMLALAGVSAEEDVDNTVAESIRMRLPWLSINLVTAFLAALVVASFSTTISLVPSLAAAMPIVTGMGGNAGAQELSVVIRALALKKISLSDAIPQLVKQISIGVFNGIAIGIIAGSVLYVMYGNFYLGIIITASMIFNLVNGCVMGLLVPLILKSINVDPALASSIFVTACTDVFGFFVFLGLAAQFIEKLI